MIESWLESGSASSAPYWTVEGALALSEGRLAFARADVLEGGAQSKAIDVRLQAAREGFETVLADSRASQDQLLRAHRRGGGKPGIIGDAEFTRYEPGTAEDIDFKACVSDVLTKNFL